MWKGGGGEGSEKLHLYVIVLSVLHGHYGAILRPRRHLQHLWTALLLDHQAVVPCGLEGVCERLRNSGIDCLTSRYGAYSRPSSTCLQPDVVAPGQPIANGHNVLSHTIRGAVGTDSEARHSRVFATAFALHHALGCSTMWLLRPTIFC